MVGEGHSAGDGYGSARSSDLMVEKDGGRNRVGGIGAGGGGNRGGSLRRRRSWQCQVIRPNDREGGRNRVGGISGFGSDQGNQRWYCSGTHKVMSERIDDGQNDDCRMNYQKDALRAVPLAEQCYSWKRKRWMKKW